MVDINSNGTTANDRLSRAGAIVTSIDALCYICNYAFGYWLAFNTRIFLPMGAVFTGVGMTMVGYRVLKARRWTGITAYAPLFVGLYPFIIMFPLVVITGHPDINAILGWGIPWFILGITMINHKRSEAPSTDGTI